MVDQRGGQRPQRPAAFEGAWGGDRHGAIPRGTGAGHGQPGHRVGDDAGLADVVDPVRLADLVRLNCVAVVALTARFLPAMVARGHGAVVNVASTAAFQPLPHMAVYGASKAFVLSFSEALWAGGAPGGRVARLGAGPGRSRSTGGATRCWPVAGACCPGGCW
ncbi:SDR family NAD(P)-dependent oxidoreductase [Candidatus Frankia alpina]|uniref:SDR family NAD(P)-dependent oxidoreductase n=1 Tax=Candidatus Frankia alpina TaxID=2699483 RepID=A0A4S5E0T6_9ACTN|nr:SDR family NAD(P)-dependent oxidoreductase [Candidatus Frankia alpina]